MTERQVELLLVPYIVVVFGVSVDVARVAAGRLHEDYWGKPFEAMTDEVIAVYVAAAAVTGGAA